MSETTILPLTQELTSDLTGPTFIPVGSSYGPAGYLQAVIPRDFIERLPEPKVAIDKSKVFDLERECQAVLSRLNYGLDATVAYEQKKMRMLYAAEAALSASRAEGGSYLATFPDLQGRKPTGGILDQFYSPSIEPDPTIKPSLHDHVFIAHGGGGGGSAHRATVTSGGWGIPSQGAAGKPMKFGDV